MPGQGWGLRGPTAILFISCDTCSDSIAKLFGLVFMGYRTIIARYVAKWGIARMCLCKIKYHWGVSHHFGGVLTSLKKYPRDMGYRSDSIAVSRDMGPLRVGRTGPKKEKRMHKKGGTKNSNTKVASG